MVVVVVVVVLDRIVDDRSVVKRLWLPDTVVDDLISVVEGRIVVVDDRG